MFKTNALNLPLSLPHLNYSYTKRRIRTLWDKSLDFELRLHGSNAAKKGFDNDWILLYHGFLIKMRFFFV